ncbi:PREDICTED: biogenesis of lysosome-related organelles complex 1 subunit 3 [Elephantulus edwardii]|uniref:biogenesis of lysosome-related organelles complex 1 subunit 3 n=1 Tax=Elephantulus edwardii TaxID=28737 RepID=UPI0003F0B22C|nr:PREDICTED: biogenesis of lysosome-related organelles complex 1 subunit 3 [Elephantulus edwardii]
MATQGRRRRPQRRPETVVPGEAAETDSELSASSSEEELYLGPSGPTRGRPTGLRVAGEAAETDSEPELELTAAPGDLPPLVVERELAGEAWGAVEGPAAAPARSLLQLRLAENSVRLARGDLCALAERLDIVASCRLLPDIRGVPGTEPEQTSGPRA